MTHPEHAAPLVLPDGQTRATARAPYRERSSWALYDFSNTIFSMNVATMYFVITALIRRRVPDRSPQRA